MIETVVGFLLVVYVLNRLPILRRWKIVFLLLALLHTYPFNFGLNYTFLRFVLPIAFLILAARQSRPWPLAACLFAGQAASLSLSPEAGFAFGASSIAYATYYFFTAGRAWLVAVAAPLAATAAFLLLTGGGYLRMLKLFARGIANFIVEPIPYILVFLFALVWLVPVTAGALFPGGPPGSAAARRTVRLLRSLAAGGVRQGRTRSCIFQWFWDLSSVPGGHFGIATCSAGCLGDLRCPGPDMDGLYGRPGRIGAC